MIPKQHNNEVLSGGLGADNAFKIKASAKAFKILSDTLYSDKIKAVIRELCCNALDSHKAADAAGTPFVVHLPTQLQPYFYVRDYGVGLCKEDVLELYSTYFESTKTESNLFTGALGLGSKSPFSYTDSFTVTSFWNGTKSQYLCYLNAEGFPQSNHLMDTQTDEPNGLKVEFAVDPKDFSAFANKATQILKWFPTEPTIKGQSIEIQKVAANKTFMNGRVELVGSQLHNPVTAVMGNVAYPVDFNIFDEVTSFQAFSGGAVVMHFELGDLDFAPSREALSYDDGTVKKIKKLWEKAVEEATKDIQDAVDKCSTAYEAKVAIRKTVLSTGMSSQALQHKFDFNGESIDGQAIAVYTKEFENNGLDAFNMKLCHFRPTQHVFKLANRFTAGELNWGWSNKYVQVTPAEHRVIFLIDEKTSYSAKIRKYVEGIYSKGLDYQGFYAIKDTDSSDLTEAALKKIFMGMPVVRTSSLAKVKAAKKDTQKTLYASVRKTDCGDSWENCEVDMQANEKFIYVEQTRDTFAGKLSSGNIKRIAMELGLTVYTLRYKKEKDKANKLSNWILLDSYLADYFNSAQFSKEDYLNFLCSNVGLGWSANQNHSLLKQIYGVSYSMSKEYKNYIKAWKTFKLRSRAGNKLDKRTVYGVAYRYLDSSHYGVGTIAEEIEEQQNKVFDSEPLLGIINVSAVRNDKHNLAILKKYLKK